VSTEHAQGAVEELRQRDKEIQVLSHVAATLSWDQETYMPEGAIDERSEQLSAIQTLAHQRLSDPAVGELLSQAGASDENPGGSDDLSDADRAFLRQLYRQHTRSTRIPEDLVKRMSAATSRGQSVWSRARRENDFSAFEPHLATIVDLNIEMAERLGYEENRYDALLDEYEPWMKTARVDEVFTGLREELVPIVSAIAGSKQVDDSFLHRSYPPAAQEEFGKVVLEKMGFDWKRGRLDVSAHPFTENLGRDDIRITTRYSPNFFNSGTFAIIHEAGHALYEQGFDEVHKGSLLASGTSLGIHESQSRFWENVIGRSLPFWRYFYPRLQETFPQALRDVTVEQFYRAVNRVEPSHIRVEADEVTYSLHIILRFRLETALLNQKISVADVPDAWRTESESLLGITPETDADGPLQDIHWSMGAMGYFPTYALGNLYAAQFARQLARDVPDYTDEVAKGNLAPALEWLRTNIHRHGGAKSATELCTDVTGEALNPSYFIDYIRNKYSGIYDI